MPTLKLRPMHPALALSVADADLVVAVAQTLAPALDRVEVDEAIFLAQIIRALGELTFREHKPLRCVYDRAHPNAPRHWLIREGVHVGRDLAACGASTGLYDDGRIVKVSKRPVTCKRCLHILSVAEQRRAKLRCR